MCQIKSSDIFQYCIIRRVTNLATCSVEFVAVSKLMCFEQASFSGGALFEESVAVFNNVLGYKE